MCLIRTQVHCTVLIKISNYPLSIFFSGSTPGGITKKGRQFTNTIVYRYETSKPSYQDIRHPTPTIDDLIQDVDGSDIFCKLDLNKAFLQLELHEDSSSITTFITHQGTHRSKRFNFGTTSASEEFQLRLERVLKGIILCKNIADDIILFATSKNEFSTEC